MRPPVKTVMKILGYAAVVGVGVMVLLAAGAAFFWIRVTSPTEFSAGEARTQLSDYLVGNFEFRLEPADMVEHGWQEQHWLDPSRCFLLRASPGRVAALRSALLAMQGRKFLGDWTTQVSYQGPTGAPGFDSGRRHPDWWLIGPPRDGDSVSVTFQPPPGGSNIHGAHFILLEPKGLVYIEVWKT